MSKRTITLVWKGLLLYITMIVTILFMGGVDSLSEKGLFIGIAIVASLIYACKRAKYSEEELTILSGERLFKKCGL